MVFFGRNIILPSFNSGYWQKGGLDGNSTVTKPSAQVFWDANRFSLMANFTINQNAKISRAIQALELFLYITSRDVMFTCLRHWGLQTFTDAQWFQVVTGTQQQGYSFFNNLHICFAGCFPDI
jgi:hypothetical protein